MLGFLRRYPAARPKDAAAEGCAALVLLAELRWQLLEHEHAQLTRLDELPTVVQPSNAEVGALLGRDCNTACYSSDTAPSTTRAHRVATREREHQVATEAQRLAAAAEQLHILRGRLLEQANQITVAETDVADWFAEVARDHREKDCSRQALVILALAAALRADGGAEPARGRRGVCAAIAQLRAAV